MKGPENFLSRLNDELNEIKLPPYTISNPNPKGIALLKGNHIKIGRLDGTYFYKMTGENFINYLRLYHSLNFQKIKSIIDPFEPILTKTVNRHLNRYNKKLYQHADGIIFQSELSYKMQKKIVGKDPKRFKIINNGVPLKLFNPSKKSPDFKTLNLVITATYRPHKRLIDAVLLTNHLVKKYNAKLNVIGQIDILTQKHLHTIDTSNCIFHGKITPENLKNLYHQCHIGLSPSIFDPCPNSVVEMMACGLPVISVKESGASELIGFDELLIEEHLNLEPIEFQSVNALPKISYKLWMEKIEYLIDDYESLRYKVLERVKKNFDIKIIASKYTNFINEINEES